MRSSLMFVCTSAAVAFVPPCRDTAPGNLDKIIHSPHIGYVVVANRSLEVFVIGTSHFRCNSAHEVTSLIEEVRPDGVVLELDPERTLRLTKRHAGFDANGVITERQSSDDVLYGADFLAAVDACQKMDIPMFLGDEYAQETKRRLTRQIMNWQAYSPGPLVESIAAGLSNDENARKRKIDLMKAFVNDPKKLGPIVITSSPPLLIAAALALFDNGAMAYDGHAILSFLGIASSILFSFFATCLLFNAVIVERDSIIAANTIHAYDVLRSLKDDYSIRKRWWFKVKGQTKLLRDADLTSSSEALPLFTLKTPLRKGAVRNLNLFEPRWLTMIDEVTKDSSDEKVFGCVRCTNKFYSAVSIDGVEGRYADVIFETCATFAKIKELKEGKRTVSGDRKINVSIEGCDSFIVDDSNVSISSDGYLRAVPAIQSKNREVGCIRSNQETITKERIRLIVVVGLLHGNGVVDLISKI